ncbi:MAG: OmpH family outer membrane protein [Bacteroidia bacterium]
MKNILYGIIAVLAICVAVLFYQVHSLKSGMSGPVAPNTETKHEPQIISSPADAKLPDAKIAYINIDTLNENYLMIADYVKVLKTRRQALDGQIQSMTQKFQQDYEAAQQSAQAGILPPAELEAKKIQLERQQSEIANKQMQMDNLAVEMQEKNEELQREVRNFLISYNQGKYDYIMAYTSAVPNILLANPKFEITSQVLQALNADYRNKKNNQKK